MVAERLHLLRHQDILVALVAELELAALAPREDAARVGDGHRMHAAAREANDLLVEKRATDSQRLVVNVERQFGTQHAVSSIAPAVQLS